MAKILRQNVGGVDFTMVGCALTGVSATSAADYVKQITLSDGDVIADGMMLVVTFANGNTAGIAPNTKTIYSSDQIDYYEDAQLTVPFTLAPAGCYDIEYTGTGNAYTYVDYPVFQVGSVSGPVCDYRGHITSGDLWEAGDSVQCMFKEGKFLLLGGSGGADIEVYDTVQDAVDDLPNLKVDQYIATKDTGSELSAPVDTVQSGNMHAVTSNAVAGVTTVSDIITIKDDATAKVIMRTYNKIAIIDIYMKIAGQAEVNMSAYNLLPMGDGNKTPLTWERQIRGEAYINSYGNISLDTQGTGVGSGQIVVFLA